MGNKTKLQRSLVFYRRQIITIIHIKNMRVVHNQYGEGTIIQRNDKTTVVNFDNHGKMTVPSDSLSEFVFGC